MKSLTQTFTEILKEAGRNATPIEEVKEALLQAVTTRDRKLAKYEKFPTNFEHPHFFDDVQEIEKRNGVIREIKQRMEKSL